MNHQSINRNRIEAIAKIYGVMLNWKSNGECIALFDGKDEVVSTYNVYVSWTIQQWETEFKRLTGKNVAQFWGVRSSEAVK